MGTSVSPCPPGAPPSPRARAVATSLAANPETNETDDWVAARCITKLLSVPFEQSESYTAAHDVFAASGLDCGGCLDAAAFPGRGCTTGFPGYLKWRSTRLEFETLSK
jgi:hypothetical protein